MAKIIRPKYSIELSIGLLLLIFSLSLFLSHQIFEVYGPNPNEGKNVYIGTFLISCAVIIMVLVLWEEFLFPIKIKPEAEGIVFRNHRNKLKTQLLIYCAIPVIFVFVFLEYEVNLLRFLFWAVVCLVAPVVGKLISGIKNYNDFLKLTLHDTIEYQNNEKSGVFLLKDIQQIELVKDDRNVLHMIKMATQGNSVIIDLDEMELEAFIIHIEKFIITHYKRLLK